MRRLVRFLTAVACTTLVLLSVLIRLDAYVAAVARPGIVPAEQAAAADVILVPGARVYEDGSVSPMLADRLDGAAALWRRGVADRILVSGHRDGARYDEVAAMRKHLTGQGVPDRAILGDTGGVDTFQSVLRARDIYRLDRVLICTQQFHLERALYIADRLGLEAQGVDTSVRPYSRIWYRTRELLARVKAFVESEICPTGPAPVAAFRNPAGLV